MGNRINWNTVLGPEDIQGGRKLIQAFNRQVADQVGGNLLKRIAAGLHGLLGDTLIAR
jgi:hypothetical protein